MRSFLVMAMFAASLAEAGWNNYEEVRELQLEAAGLDVLVIDAGAGSMQVRGADDVDAVHVTARIGVNDADGDKAQRIIEKRAKLTLDKAGSEGRLLAVFEQGVLGLGSDGYIALEIEVPTRMALRIDDGAGSIRIDDVGAIDIDDGSGSIKIRGANGDVRIVDGSGSVSVRDVEGSVTIDDGSGSIQVRNVSKDFIVVDDGSGSVTHKDVRGRVDAES